MRGGKHMCNNKPEARMHKYHAEITGWLKDSDEGQDYEGGGKKKKVCACGEVLHVIKTPPLIISKASFFMKAGSNSKAAADTGEQGRALAIAYSRHRRQGGPAQHQ